MIKCKSMRKVFWNEISDQIKALNGKLWTALEELSASKKFANPAFYELTYGYGEWVIEKGEFQLPEHGRQTLNQANIDQIMKDLDYSTIPLGLVLSKTVEVSVSLDERIIPLRLLECGEIFGVFETSDVLVRDMSDEEPEPARWNVSAGARSIVVLSPHNAGFIDKLGKAIKRVPDLPLDNKKLGWKAIMELNRHGATDPWTVRVLVFPKWVVKADGEARRLHELILKYCLMQGRPFRDYSVEEAFIERAYMNLGAQERTGNKSELFFYHTVRHLLAISRGEMPAFGLSIGDPAQAGPFDFYRDLVSELKGPYSGLVLHPVRLADPGSTGLYSVNFPTFLAPAGDQIKKAPFTNLKEVRKILWGLHTRSSGRASDRSLLTKFRFDFPRVSYYTKNREGVAPNRNIRISSDLSIADFARGRITEVPIPDLSIYSQHPWLNGAIKIVRAE